jgi:hypothetical protein
MNQRCFAAVSVCSQLDFGWSACGDRKLVRPEDKEVEDSSWIK